MAEIAEPGPSYDEAEQADQPLPRGLYWNANGRVACHSHAPLAGGSLWTLEGWMAVPDEILPNAELTCENCKEGAQS